MSKLDVSIVSSAGTRLVRMTVDSTSSNSSTSLILGRVSLKDGISRRDPFFSRNHARLDVVDDDDGRYLVKLVPIHPNPCYVDRKKEENVVQDFWDDEERCELVNRSADGESDEIRLYDGDQIRFSKDGDRFFVHVDAEENAPKASKPEIAPREALLENTSWKSDHLGTNENDLQLTRRLEAAADTLPLNQTGNELVEDACVDVNAPHRDDDDELDDDDDESGRSSFDGKEKLTNQRLDSPTRDLQLPNVLNGGEARGRETPEAEKNGSTDFRESHSRVSNSDSALDDDVSASVSRPKCLVKNDDSRRFDVSSVASQQKVRKLPIWWTDMVRGDDNAPLSAKDRKSPAKKRKIKMEDLLDDSNDEEFGAGQKRRRKDSPMKDSSMKVSSMKDSPLKDSPLKDSPMKDSPMKDSPIKISPVKDFVVTKEDRRGGQQRESKARPDQKIKSTNRTEIRANSPTDASEKEIKRESTELTANDRRSTSLFSNANLGTLMNVMNESQDEDDDSRTKLPLGAEARMKDDNVKGSNGAVVKEELSDRDGWDERPMNDKSPINKVPSRKNPRSDIDSWDEEPIGNDAGPSRDDPLSDKDSWEGMSPPGSPSRIKDGQSSSTPMKKEAPSSSSKLLKPQSRPKCQFGKECYRKNPAHFKESSHPGDADWVDEEEEEEEEDEETQSKKQWCEYGADCYRKHPQHRKDFLHPKPGERPSRRAAIKAKNQTKKKKKTGNEDDDDEDDEYESSFINDDSDLDPDETFDSSSSDDDDDNDEDEDEEYKIDDDDDDEDQKQLKRLKKEAKKFAKK